MAGTSPERPAPTTFRRSVSSGRCERDSEDQASAVVGGRSFLASVRNTRQFETFTDGVGGGWVHPSVVRDRSFSVTEEKHALFVRSDTRGIMRPWLTLANRARRFILRLSGARSGCKVSPALPIFPAANRPHDRRQLSCDLWRDTPMAKRCQSSNLVDGSDEVEDVQLLQILLQNIRTLAEKKLGRVT